LVARRHVGGIGWAVPAALMIGSERRGAGDVATAGGVARAIARALRASAAANPGSKLNDLVVSVSGC